MTINHEFNAWDEYPNCKCMNKSRETSPFIKMNNEWSFLIINDDN